jgi:coenzyme F420-0:L-glutamate ligase/coenzyme F420-1:gamma-L-glutamate ligase
VSSQQKTLQLTGVSHVPMVRPGDDLGTLLIDAMAQQGLALQDHDIVVVAQKVVSKAEGRYVDLRQITPSVRALELAELSGKDARLVEVILSESDDVLRCRDGLLIVRHRLGLVMANAGVDQSNIEPGGAAERVLLLPQDPDDSSARLKQALDDHFGARVGVAISDSVGRAWRIGTVGLALGLAGLPAVQDFRGRGDLYDRALQVTEVGFADQVAASAALLMGEGSEGVPAVLVRGLQWSDADTTAAPLIRPREQDLFQ